MTESKTPLSTAGAIVYAIAGCAPSLRTFLPRTRFEPCRAGINATALGEPVVLTSRFSLLGSCSWFGMEFARLRPAPQFEHRTRNFEVRTEPEHEPRSENLEA